MAGIYDFTVKDIHGKTVDLEVPASSHFVLEGYVEPGERRLLGRRAARAVQQRQQPTRRTLLQVP